MRAGEVYIILKKKETFVFLFCACFFLIILKSCRTSETAAAQQLYEGLSRTEILDKCISCHPNEHENELLGPHSFAYHSLMEHEEVINHPDYPEKPYTAHVNEVLTTVCVRCHVPQNLFESNYKGLELVADISTITKESHPQISSPPPVRTDTLTYLSGVDCITCHFNGTNVVAGANFKEDPKDRKMKDYCFPIKSEFLSSNLFCATCHNHDVESLHENFQAGLITEEQSCNSCHIEKLDGKNTHYFYWRHDPAEKRSFEFYNKLFENLTATEGEEGIEIVWVNSAIPHIFNRVREIVTKVEVLDSEDRLLHSDTIRLNRKYDHITFMKPILGTYELPGIDGYVFKPGDTIHEQIPVAATQNAAKLKISAYNKAQFFFPDSMGVLMYENEIPIKKAKPL